MSPVWSPGLALPPLCQPGDLLCPDDLALAAERTQVRCVAIFWGHGHHARRPEPSKRGARVLGPSRGPASSLCSQPRSDEGL